jgi:hypothetical protein
MQPWKDRRNRPFVLIKIFSESLFQFFILKSDHDCSTQHRECSQRIADGQTSAKTPSEHFAKMRKIHWMANSAVYPCSDQPLFASTGHDFGNSAELLNAKILPRFRIKPESGAEKKCSWHPSPQTGVQHNVAPGSRDKCSRDPQSDPKRQQHAIR